MDINDLAKQLTPLIISLLTTGATAAAAKMGEETIATLWEKIRAKIDKKGQGEIAEKVKENPNDDDLKVELKVWIREVLKENPALAQEAQRAIQIRASGGSVVVGENMTGGSISVFNDHHQETHITYQADKKDAPVSIEQLTHDYLEHLKRDCEKLPLGTIHVKFSEVENESSISLEDVYIDLDVAPRSRKERGQKEMESMERQERRVSIVEALNDKSLRRAVLLGEAGSGKTTCVHYLTLALASIQQKAISKMPLPEDSALARYFPVRLILREAATEIPDDEKTDSVDILWNALKTYLIKKLGVEQADLLFPHLQKTIKTTPCLIMLDGLDEVPEAERRRPRLLKAIEDFSAPLEQSIVLVTARPYAYDKWKLAHFEVLDLLNFSSEQIENFISKFYDSVGAIKRWDADFINSQKTNLNAAVQNREYLYDLAARPLLLTLIAAVDSNGEKLPEDRAELYKQTIDLLLQRWQNRKDNSLTEKKMVEFFSADSSKVIGILQRLAYKVHERQGRDKNRKTDAPADIDKVEVWGEFASSLPSEVDIHSLLGFLEKRAGLLLDRGENVYTFPHRSFQEYLAAGFLNTQSDTKYQLDQIFRSEPNWWREVVLLSIARMLPNLKSAADEINRLVPCEVDGETDVSPTDWQIAALAGQALVEMKLLEKGGDQKYYKTIIKRVANWLAQLVQRGALDPRPRAEAGKALAKLGDPRKGVINDFLFCRIPAGEFMMGSKQGEKDSLDSERPQFKHKIEQPFYMTRYPITNAQFDLFVKDPQGYVNDKWWTEAGLEWRKDRKAPDKRGGVFDLPNHPFVMVRWYEAAAYCKWLTEKLQDTSYKIQAYDPQTRSVFEDDNLKSKIVNRKSEIRLPTEAEWEYAARAGTGTPYSWGDKITPNHANYSDTGIGATSAVGLFPDGENKFGLLDMNGNVWEWCATQWQEDYKDYLKNEEKLNQLEGNSLRVLRGGSFDLEDGFVRCAYRFRDFPNLRYDDVGFRVVVCAGVSHFS
ncbi:MAG: SUMF1/EgtB/PvdO family nonheme iron enzyme [Anaerolineales bacterium]